MSAATSNVIHLDEIRSRRTDRRQNDTERLLRVRTELVSGLRRLDAARTRVVHHLAWVDAELERSNVTPLHR